MTTSDPPEHRPRLASHEDIEEISSKVDLLRDELMAARKAQSSRAPEARWIINRIGDLVYKGATEGIKQTASKFVSHLIVGALFAAAVWTYRDCKAKFSVESPGWTDTPARPVGRDGGR